jgi:hypothetical protein
MRGKSRGLPGKLGCEKVHRDEGHCLAGDRMIVLCREPGEWQTSDRFRTGRHRLFQSKARRSAIAKLEVGYTSTRK